MINDVLVYEYIFYFWFMFSSIKPGYVPMILSLRVVHALEIKMPFMVNNIITTKGI